MFTYNKLLSLFNTDDLTWKTLMDGQKENTIFCVFLLIEVRIADSVLYNDYVNSCNKLQNDPAGRTKFLCKYATSVIAMREKGLVICATERRQKANKLLGCSIEEFHKAMRSHGKMAREMEKERKRRELIEQ